MVQSQHALKDDDIDALLVALKPELDAVELDVDISESTAAAIAFGELSGTEADDFSKKLMALLDRGRVSDEEVERIFLHLHGKT